MKGVTVAALVALLFAGIMPARAAFSDVPADYFAAEAISSLSQKQLLKGYADGSFRPYSPVNRAEWAKLLTAVLPQLAGEAPVSFRDVPANAWFYTPVSRLYGAQVVRGYPDGTFRPAAVITRAEAIKMLLLAKGISEDEIWARYSFWQQRGNSVEDIFTDVLPSQWFAPYMLVAKEEGLLWGKEEGGRLIAAPLDLLYRGEAAALLNKVLSVSVVAELPAAPVVVPQPVPAPQVVASVPAVVLDPVPQHMQTPVNPVAAAAPVSSPTPVSPVAGPVVGALPTPVAVITTPVVPATPKPVVTTPAPVHTPTPVQPAPKQEVKPEPKPAPQPEIKPAPKPETPAPKPEPKPAPAPTPAPKPAPSPYGSTSATEKASFDASGVWQGRHITLRLHPDTAKQLTDPKLFVDKLDRVYDFYADLVQGTPYGGSSIVMEERCGRVNSPAASLCPNGYMTWYDQATPSDYWATAGNPVEMTSSSWRQTIQQFNTTGAFPLGVLHELGHDFDDVSSRPQYMFHTASVEAWANLKVMYAIDAAGVSVELRGKIYKTSKDLIDGFYRPFLQEYQNQGLSFESLISQGPIAGSKTDYYISLLLPLIDATGRDALFQTIHFYKSYEYDLPYIGTSTYEDKRRRFGQFLLIWSCKSGKDLAGMLQPYRMDISSTTTSLIGQCVRESSSNRTNSYILSLLRSL